MHIRQKFGTRAIYREGLVYIQQDNACRQLLVGVGGKCERIEEYSRVLSLSPDPELFTAEEIYNEIRGKTSKWMIGKMGGAIAFWKHFRGVV